MVVFDAQAKVQGFDYIVWNGIRHEEPKTGVSRAHKQIVQEAKENGRRMVIISEDDVMFTCPTSFNHYFANMPEDFDIYLGGVSGGTVKNKTISFFSGFFFYTVHERFYDAFLAADETCNIDRWVSNLGTKKITEILGRPPVYKICYPIIAITSNGWSDNFGKEMDYSNYFRQYQLYAG